jgi:hypothetical protein
VVDWFGGGGGAWLEHVEAAEVVCFLGGLRRPLQFQYCLSQRWTGGSGNPGKVGPGLDLRRMGEYF